MSVQNPAIINPFGFMASQILNSDPMFRIENGDKVLAWIDSRVHDFVDILEALSRDLTEIGDNNMYSTSGKQATRQKRREQALESVNELAVLKPLIEMRDSAIAGIAQWPSGIASGDFIGALNIYEVRNVLRGTTQTSPGEIDRVVLDEAKKANDVVVLAVITDPLKAIFNQSKLDLLRETWRRAKYKDRFAQFDLAVRGLGIHESNVNKARELTASASV
jgi:hypothetical protein